MRTLDFLRDLHSGCVETANELRIGGVHEFGIACAYCRTIELGGAFIVLADNDKWTGAPIVLRSMLEGYAHLRNLMLEPNYAKRMEASHADAWAKRIRRARRDRDDPDLEDLRDADESWALLAKYEVRVEELEAEGAPPLKALDRLQLAGMEGEYGSIYSLLSGETHADLGTLTRCHSLVEHGRQRVTLYVARTFQERFVWCDTAAGLLLSATEITHVRLAGGRPDWVEVQWETLRQLREAITG